MNDHEPTLFGAVTVGERGQIVIPQAAREGLGIKPGDKILVMGGGMHNQGLMLIKAEALSEFLAQMSAKFSERLNHLEKLLHESTENRDKGDETDPGLVR